MLYDFETKYHHHLGNNNRKKNERTEKRETNSFTRSHMLFGGCPVRKEVKERMKEKT